MKFNLKDFIQLDTDGLLAVNGGSPCGGSPDSSPSSGGDPGSGGSGGGSDNDGGNSGGSGGDTSGGNGSSSNSTSGNSGYRVTENKDGTITVHQPDGHSYTYSKNNKKQTTSGSSSRGGYCSGASDGTTRTKNPYYQDDDGGDDKGGTNKPGSRPDDAVPDTTGGCGKISTPSKPQVPEEPVEDFSKSGKFAQITDGSYADLLTMQYYTHQYANAQNDLEITQICNDDNYMNGDNKFSTSGCLMTDCAKVVSEKSGQDYTLKEINDLFDSNSDGLLAYEEIKQGFINVLGEQYNIEADYWEKELGTDKFIDAAQKGDTYVLARAYGDFDGDGTTEHHWVLLEGYTTDSEGRMIFSYDGTSDNDAAKNRVYIYGDPHSKNEFKIDKIETFRITSK